MTKKKVSLKPKQSMAYSKKTVDSKRKGSLSSDDLWHNDPDLIRQFIERRPDYEQLCAEVAYILRKRLQSKNIEYSTVLYRAKTLNSFFNKLNRKKYSNLLTEVTDFAGVRVVSLYVSDLKLIEAIIQKEFDVVEKIDKLKEKTSDQFGYLANHYIVKLGRRSSGARYDDLKNLVCEIQVRTVLQDAWAIIQHHLVYKHESKVPKDIHRKLNSLAGLLETADDQFDNVRDKREA